jgi:hypothetical protein
MTYSLVLYGPLRLCALCDSSTALARNTKVSNRGNGDGQIHLQYKPTGKDPSVEKMIPVGDPVSP